MKPDIHPNYETTIFRCSCGNILETQSNLGGDHHIEICSKCHPFFSGQGKQVLDTTGRIEKFNKRYKRAS